MCLSQFVFCAVTRKMKQKHNNTYKSVQFQLHFDVVSVWSLDINNVTLSLVVVLTLLSVFIRHRGIASQTVDPCLAFKRMFRCH